MGTNTRQRSPLDWTPLSLLRLNGRHQLAVAVSAPHPSPPILAACSVTNEPDSLNGQDEGTSAFLGRGSNARSHNRNPAREHARVTGPPAEPL